MNDNLLFLHLHELEKKLDLSIDTSIEESLTTQKHPLYTSLASCQDGERVVFRVALSGEINRRVLREIQIYTTAKKKQLSYFPKILKHGVCHGHSWLIYRYINGELAGNVYQFRKSFDFEKIFFFLDQKKELSNHFSPQLFSTFSELDFSRMLDHSMSVCPFEIKKFTTNIIKKINVNIKEIKTRILTHCDLHPQNIIIDDKKKLSVIDWESSCLSSPAYDYSFIWSRCGNSEVQKKLWHDLLSKYPGIEKEALVMFMITALRDYIGWNEIKLDKNPYLVRQNIIDRIDPEKKIHDLKNAIEAFSKSL